MQTPSVIAVISFVSFIRNSILKHVSVYLFWGGWDILQGLWDLSSPKQGPGPSSDSAEPGPLDPRELFFLRTSFFKSSFRFIAKLRGRCRDFPYTLCSYTCIASPIISIPHQSGTLVINTSHELYTDMSLLHRIHSSHEGSLLVLNSFYEFGQIYNDTIYHYSITLYIVFTLIFSSTVNLETIVYACNNVQWYFNIFWSFIVH